MKKVLFVLFVVMSANCYAQTSLKDAVFDRWFISGNTTIHYNTIDEILQEFQEKKINPMLMYGGHIEPEIDDNIKDIERWFGAFFKYDIDGDGYEEILVEQTLGSGAFPYFFILKYNHTRNQYYSVYDVQREMLPFMFKGQLYFSGIYQNYYSGITETIDVVTLNEKYELQKAASFNIERRYNFDTVMQKYITDEEIYDIQRHDYNFLNKYIVAKHIHKHNGIEYFTNFTAHFDGYNIVADIPGTNKWSTFMNVTIHRDQIPIKNYFLIHGIAIHEQDGHTFITILEPFEPDHRGRKGDEYLITVYDAENFEAIYKNSYIPSRTISDSTGG